MFTTENGGIAYCGGGLFVTDAEWIHPRRCEETYEMIYMVRGTAFMEEGGAAFTLHKGDLKILRPGVFHGGLQKSTAPTSFYWHHFKLFGNESDFLPKQFLFQSFSGSGIFPEILHMELLGGKQAAEPALLYLLNKLKFSEHAESSSARLANRVLEYVRLHANALLTVEKTAEHFGYHPEYISKIVKRKFGTGLKNVIDSNVMNRANDLLDNSDFSIKEIAAMLGFREANSFVHFYKYHENITPTSYRNRNFKIHMNNR